MAESLPLTVEQDLGGIKGLLWGDNIKPDIFRRWSQGFNFSASEPTALEQSEGGPCAILAPTQAFILKNLLLKYNDLSFREKVVSSELQDSVLANALSEILEQCSTQKYYNIVYLSRDINQGLASEAKEANVENDSLCDLDTPSSRFHENLRVITFQNIEEVKKHLLDNIHLLKAQYGVVLFLYSVLLTRGLEGVQSDSNDTSEPLIDSTYGYGSQSLINLMITGRATTYVWDSEEDVGGLKLKGVEKQSKIGFITIMEYLRYCTVGAFYKNPIHPVWVLGSETHLTVLFSTEKKLVSPETKTDEAKRIFKHYDPEGNNFITSALLQDVLHMLDLVSDEPYVEVMRKKLDPESLGIILLNNFMEEFFPKEENPMPDLFSLVHYNGLTQSNVQGQIKYRIGECVLLEQSLRAVSENNPMLTALQTKWPNIEVRWNGVGTPSLN